MWLPWEGVVVMVEVVVVRAKRVSETVVAPARSVEGRVVLRLLRRVRWLRLAMG